MSGEQTIMRGASTAHDVDEMFRRIEAAVEPYPKAAMFELAADGRDSAFEQLVGCMISIRTRDEVSLPVARRLFKEASSAEEMVRLGSQRIAELIQGCSFHTRKAVQIQAIAEDVANNWGGFLPCDREVMLSYAGVGPKCANLALGVACGEAVISVDVHVHRICNRWGYVQTETPEQTMDALTEKLPHRYWVAINRLLVPFGKHFCGGRSPLCSRCPVEEWCERRGVTVHR